jgi:hypothetical protein
MADIRIDTSLAELPFQHCDPVPRHQNLDVLVPIVHREQAKHGEGFCQAEVGQSQQHGRSSCRENASRVWTAST